jgi:hypothetical protein
MESGWRHQAPYRRRIRTACPELPEPAAAGSEDVSAWVGCIRLKDCVPEPVDVMNPVRSRTVALRLRLSGRAGFDELLAGVRGAPALRGEPPPWITKVGLAVVTAPPAGDVIRLTPIGAVIRAAPTGLAVAISGLEAVWAIRAELALCCSGRGCAADAPAHATTDAITATARGTPRFGAWMARQADPVLSPSPD